MTAEGHSILHLDLTYAPHTEVLRVSEDKDVLWTCSETNGLWRTNGEKEQWLEKGGHPTNGWPAGLDGNKLTFMWK